MKLVLYGVSSPYAAEALETTRRLGWDLAACVRNLPGADVPAELVNVVELDALEPAHRKLPFAVPLITPFARLRATQEARAQGFETLASLLDPTALIAVSAVFGEGAYVNARAIVAAGVRAGAGCLINRGASLGHHCQIEDYVTIGPGVVTGGSCRFRRGSFLGVGAVIAPEVEIGANAVVGAGAVVVADVPAEAVMVGNPARVLRKAAGYGGIGIPEL